MQEALIFNNLSKKQRLLNEEVGKYEDVSPMGTSEEKCDKPQSVKDECLHMDRFCLVSYESILDLTGTLRVEIRIWTWAGQYL